MEGGGPPQPADTNTSDAAPPPQLPDPQNHVQKSLALLVPAIPATPSYGGRFLQYNVSGDIFEVTAKYKKPVMPVGKGFYGFVCSALNTETNESVAIKKIANAFVKKADVKTILREIQLLRHMSHENVVAIRDVIPPPQRECFNDVYIVYELMEGSMLQFLRSGQEFVTEHCQYFLYQILRGLKYIHSSNVLHRDLRPSNLLLSAECDLKICDFRLACLTSESDLMIIEHGVDRWWYRSPELVLNSSYTVATDIWSVGCIFMELMNRKPLFPGKDHLDQLRLLLALVGTPSEAEMELLHENPKNIIRHLPRYPPQSFAKKFPNAHPLGIDLAEKMLRFDPRLRITVEDALAHPYLTTLHDESDEPVSMIPFKFGFKQAGLTKEKMKELIYQEALAFNPYHH